MKPEQLVEVFAEFAAKIELEGWWHLRYQTMVIVCTKSPTKWLIYDIDMDDYLRSVWRLSLVVIDSVDEYCDESDALSAVALTTDWECTPEVYLIANLTEDDLRALAPSARVIWTHPAPEKNQ